MGIIIFGDDHIREQQPFYTAKQNFFDWCLDQPWNSSDNIMIHVGDLFHINEPTPKEYNLAFKFLSNTKFKHIYILSGNGAHEYSIRKNSYAIDPLQSINNVTIVKQPYFLDYGNLEFLLLPWIPDTRSYSDITGMKKEYEQLLKEKEPRNYDYVVGHFSHKMMWGDFIDIGFLKGKRRMGHIHIPDEEFVGVNTITRSDEKGISCTLNYIHDGKEELLPIPCFLDFEEIDYQIDVKNIKSKASDFLINIKDAPSIKEAKEKFASFYINSIKLKSFKNDDFSNDQKTTKISLEEHMNNFIEKRKIKKDLKEKLKKELTI